MERGRVTLDEMEAKLLRTKASWMKKSRFWALVGSDCGGGAIAGILGGRILAKFRAVEVQISTWRQWEARRGIMGARAYVLSEKIW